MINNNNISLNDILEKFRTHTKVAEDVGPAAAVVTPEAAQPVDPAAVLAAKKVLESGADAEDGTQYCDPESGECVEEDDEATDATPEDMAAKADELSDLNDASVAAANTLKNMAEDYIDKHDQSIAKEAAVFGEMFADAAFERLQKRAEAYAFSEEYGGYLQKVAANVYLDAVDMLSGGSEMTKIAEDAYIYSLCKLAADEAYAETAKQLASAADAEEAAAKAVSDSASAAKALVEHLTEKKKEEEAANAVYNDAMAQLDPQQQPQQPAAPTAQDTYADAMAQLAPQQQPPVNPGVAQNAYEQAMGQLQQPQMQ